MVFLSIPVPLCGSAVLAQNSGANIRITCIRERGVSQSNALTATICELLRVSTHTTDERIYRNPLWPANKQEPLRHSVNVVLQAIKSVGGIGLLAHRITDGKYMVIAVMVVV
ncbi:hypothetical protein CVT25_001089 [Psilocybe cyanescens]|uniref:Uncharacterized protein n=1 Tax=Psilocybe cyanescens TaxID=93625 RepID=A0A409XB44_PSICY|nr:hypothetical protein CVT25_001089 [Psilocybe cyanescens]